MTRYEMAAVVSRLLARIESLERTPQPQSRGAAPPPEVTKEDVDLIRFLIDEFRAELAVADLADLQIQGVWIRIIGNSRTFRSGQCTAWRVRRGQPRTRWGARVSPPPTTPVVFHLQHR